MMKSIVIAALLAMTPVPAYAAVPTQSTSISQVVETTSNICIAVATRKMTFEEVSQKLKLSKDDQQFLAFSCMMYLQGVRDGVEAIQSQQEVPTT
jgi:hypothetical protein